MALKHSTLGLPATQEIYPSLCNFSNYVNFFPVEKESAKKTSTAINGVSPSLAMLVCFPVVPMSLGLLDRYGGHGGRSACHARCIDHLHDVIVGLSTLDCRVLEGGLRNGRGVQQLISCAAGQGAVDVITCDRIAAARRCPAEADRGGPRPCGVALASAA